MLMVQGLLILTAGMGLVIVFLLVMILVMDASAVIVPKFNYLLPDPVVRKAATPSVVAAGSADVAVAIAAAAARQRV